MRTSIYVALFILAIVSRAFAAHEFALTNTVTVTAQLITELSEQLRTNHPALAAATARAAAAEANAAAVRVWEDPMARIGTMAGRTDMRAEDGDLVYGVEQLLPLWGKPQAARRLATAEAMAEQSKIDYEFQTRRRDLAQALFRAALANRAVVLAREDIEWLDTLVQSVEARFQNGTATLNELLQVQNERSRRTNGLANDLSKLSHEHIALNRFVQHATTAAWPVLDLPAPASRVAFTDQLLRLAFQAEPRIKVIENELKQAQAGVRATRKQKLPDVSIGAQGRNYSRNGDLRSAEVMLSLNLPWGNRSRYKNEIRREEARARATEFELLDYRNELVEEIHQLTVTIENARREAVLYREEIIPRTRTALDAAHAAWTSGGGAFRDVLDARRMLTEAQLMYANAVSEQYQAMSELVLCCGLGDLEALQMIGVKEEPGPGTQP